MIASVVFLVLLSAPVPRQAASNPPSRPTHVDKNSASNQKPTPSLVQNPPSAAKTENASNAPAGESEPRRVVIVGGPGKDKWDKVNICLTGGLVLVAVFTLVAVWFQAVKTRDAADATADSVKAIKNQSDILERQFVSENRPWILIPWGDDSHRIGEPYLTPAVTVPHEEQRRTHCMFPIGNYGKSPARITAAKTQLQIGPSRLSPPDTSVYEINRAVLDNFILAQNGFTFVEAELFPVIFITPEQKAEIDSRESFVWLCGFFRYSHSLGLGKRSDSVEAEYETRFCYLWETTTNAPHPYWRLAGPKKYNDAR